METNKKTRKVKFANKTEVSWKKLPQNADETLEKRGSRRLAETFKATKNSGNAVDL